MTEALDLSMLTPGDVFGDDPFTPADAARVGFGRAALERLVRTGQVRRLVRGVYRVDTATPLTCAQRAAALARVIGPRHLVAGRTAAWVHGVDQEALGPLDGAVPLDLGACRPEEEVRFGRLRVLAATATAVDLCRRLPAEQAVAALDGMLAAGSLSTARLLTALAGSGDPGAVELGARADGRARNAAESRLRWHWLEARMPTPRPGHRVGGVRLALALPVQRFAAVLRTPGQAPLERVEARGWRVVRLAADRILSAEPAYLREHLEREFHQHLLAQVG
jgi:hypothetical protein